MSTTTPVALIIHEPQGGNTPSDVLAMPMEPQGKLCRCRGNNVVPAGTMSMGVSLIRTDHGAPAPTTNDYFNSNDRAFPDNAGNWTYDQRLTVNCAASPTNFNNSLYAALAYLDPTNWTRHLSPASPTPVHFKGKQVIQCSSTVAAPQPPQAAKAMPAASTLSSPFQPVRDAQPDGFDGGWVLYQNLGVDLLHEGNRLMSGGQPLRASTIQVAAANVAWEYGQFTYRRIRRAVGEAKTATVDWFFQSAPQAAIVIWQGVRNDGHVVMSQCRNSPDTFSLDPESDIYVQVNHHWVDTFARRGGFDLWVRIG